MNDTLANITKTFLGNADEDLEFFLPASPLSPPAVLPWPPPLLKHKDGKQNFQESENLIYLKGKKETSQKYCELNLHVPNNTALK